MPVKYIPWLTRDMLRAVPEARFVFGDNCLRTGYGGQAAACRGEPNAIGVRTKRAPSMSVGSFMTGSDTDMMAVKADLAEVQKALDEGRDVFVPADGLGTGLAQLPQRAPKVYRMIVDFFREADGMACPW